MVQIIDEWMEYPLLMWYGNHFLYNLPHMWGHSSDVGTPAFYASPILDTSVISQQIAFKIKYTTNWEYDIHSMYINIQHQGMDGSWHKDADSDLTVVWMVTPNEGTGGDFEYKEEGKVKTIDYVQNRLVLFEGTSIEHRGRCFVESYLPRISLACKMVRR